MATDESSRLLLYEKARDTFGDEAARTLMDALPRDAGDLVTKDYLDQRLAEVTSTLTSRLLVTILTSNATLVGLVLAAVKLG